MPRRWPTGCGLRRFRRARSRTRFTSPARPRRSCGRGDRDVIKIYYGADVRTVVEEFFHAQTNKELREGTITRQDLEEAARVWAAETGTKIADPQKMTDTELQELVADMGVAYFFNERKNLPSLPASIRAFIAKAWVYFKEVLGRAKRLKELQAEGKISGEMEGFWRGRSEWMSR